MEQVREVAVVGGGIAGLSCAIHLARCGVPLEILEKRDDVGGSGLGEQRPLPGIREPQRLNFTFHGYWSGGRNLNRMLNGLSAIRLHAGLPRMMPVHRFLVVRADRLKDARGRLAGPPGLREYDNFVLIDEPLLSELWGMATLRSLHPYKLSWAGRMARVVSFAVGAVGGAALLWVGWLLRDPARLLEHARKERAYRLLAAAVGHEPPLWLDDWTLDELLRLLPFPSEVADWIILFQKLLNQPPPDVNSARHAARAFDHYALRSPAALWWQMPVKSDQECVVEPLKVHLADLEHVKRIHGFQVRHIGGPRDGHLPCHGDGDLRRARHVVVAAGVQGSGAVMRATHDGGLEAGHVVEALAHQREGTVQILHVWFKKRIHMFERFATPIAMLGARHVACPFDLLWVSSKWQQDHYQAPGDVFGFQLSEQVPASKTPSADDLRRQEKMLERVLGWTWRMFPELRAGKDSVLHHHFSEPVTCVGGGVGARRHGVRVDPFGEGGAPLYLCGDWVYQEESAMYMERACVTGIEAANRILRRLGREPWPLLKPPPPTRLQRNAQWVTDMVEDEAEPLEPPWSGARRTAR